MTGPQISPDKVQQIRKGLLHWFQDAQRDLPWRRTRDPYAILVSEVMLQQTQVDRVIPYYARFLERFPTARDLAQAPVADVIKLWAGLGYNRRAVNLHGHSHGRLKPMLRRYDVGVDARGFRPMTLAEITAR